MGVHTLAVIGMGAVGGSLAWHARLAGIPRVIGYSREPSDTLRALKAGAITEIADSPAKAVREADLLALATAPGPALALLDRIAPRLPASALIMDLSSVQAPGLARAASLGLADRFVGAHPVTGPAEPGFAGAAPDRLRGVIVYVCPSGTPSGYGAARHVMSFWNEVVGASPILIDAEAHDRDLAWTTHLPRAAAAALAVTLAGSGIPGVAFGSPAREATGPAAVDPGLWSEILLLNRKAVIEALGRLGADLGRLRELVAAGDAAGLRSWLEQAATFRRQLDG